MKLLQHLGIQAYRLQITNVTSHKAKGDFEVKQRIRFSHLSEVCCTVMTLLSLCFVRSRLKPL